jgi:hypothetical protein
VAGFILPSTIGFVFNPIILIKGSLLISQAYRYWAGNKIKYLSR